MNGGLQPGAVVASRFELVRELGRGGMGAVWVAKHLALDTLCAVKFIETEVATKAPGARERFEREAKAAAQLRSPHVVHILDYGVWEDQPYIAMELLEGESLAERLARTGRLTPEDTVTIIVQVARALTKAHAAGIVHRDLKPENIFLVHDDDRDVVKVLDFGIAKVGAGGSSFTRTATGQILGTPYYMSPEQADGTLAVDARSDLWSLGVIAFECLVGSPPIQSEALGDLLNRIMNKPLPVPSAVSEHVPDGFDAWFARACARPLDERFQTAKELADSLADALGMLLDRGRERPSGPGASAPRTRRLELQTTTPGTPPSRGTVQGLGRAASGTEKRSGPAAGDTVVQTPALEPGSPPRIGAPTFAGHTRSSGDITPPARLRRALVLGGAAAAIVVAAVVVAGRRGEPDEVPPIGVSAATTEAHQPATADAPVETSDAVETATPAPAASIVPAASASAHASTKRGGPAVAQPSHSATAQASASSSSPPATASPVDSVDPGF